MTADGVTTGLPGPADGRADAARFLGAVLGVLVPFTCLTVLGSWSLVAGLVTLAVSRVVIVRRTTVGSPLRAGVTWALACWAAVALVLLALLLTIPVGPGID
ncbi:hypothetical protein ACQP60_11180 [Isoptericola variabilis]|uniref:hypothetical protein n=1 Tax=Isoptericola variabilis TaxID=139208 RepID=UPI003D19FDFE